jgi:integrase
VASDRGARERVAPGVVKRHTRDCGKSAGRARCSCTPTFVARLRLGPGGAAASRERTFATLSEAVVWMQAGRTGNVPAGSVPTLRSGARAFYQRARDGHIASRAGSPYKPTTLAAYRTALDVRVLDWPDPVTGLLLGDLPADRLLEPRALQRLVTAWTEAGTSNESIRQAVAAVRAVLRWMYQAGHLPTLPPAVLLPSPHKPRDRVATDAEADALIAAAVADDQQHRRSLIGPLVRLVLASGLRVSEALTLTWGDGLDLAGDEVMIRVADSKTTAGLREVLVLDRATVNAVRAHRLATGRPADGLPVFAGRDGQPYKRHGAPRYALARVRAAAARALLVAEGVALLEGEAGEQQAATRLAGIAWHALRHTHATNLGTDPSVDAVTLSQRLGHADPAFTARRYVHGREDRARELARIAAGLA